MNKTINDFNISEKQREEYGKLLAELVEASTSYIEVKMKAPIALKNEGNETHIVGMMANIVFSEELVKNVGQQRCALTAANALFSMLPKLHHLFHTDSKPGETDHCEFYMKLMESFFHELTGGDKEMEKLLLVARLTGLGGHEGINVIKVPIMFNGDTEKTAEDVMNRFTKPKAEA